MANFKNIITPFIKISCNTGIFDLTFLRFSSTLVFFILITGCKTATYSHVDAVLDPKYKIPQHISTIGVMDRSVMKTGNTPGKSTGIVTTTDEAKNVLLNDIKNGIPVKGAKLERPRRDGKENGPADQIKSTQIKEYANTLDGLFCLEEFDFTEQRTYKDIKKEQLDPSGKKYVIAAVAGTRIIYLRTYWRLYDGKSGQVLMTIPQYTENSFETEGLNRQGVNAQMDTTNIVTVSTLSRQLSRNLIRDINPEPIRSHWMYYRKGNETIQRSSKLIESGDFRSAVEFLSQKSKALKEDKMKSRINYNLALSYYFNKQKDLALQLAAHEYNRTGKREFKELYDKIYMR